MCIRDRLISESSDEVSISDCGDNDTMPENESYCYKESGDILLDGIVNASGRFTSNGSTEFTQMLSHSSLVGSGLFEVDTSEGLESYGTINGTGIFSGTGDFSGPMVQAGTFHLSDMIPGDYAITAILGDGSRVDLGEVFTVSATQNAQSQKVDIPGNVISGLLISEAGSVIDGYAALLSEGADFSDAIEDCSISMFAPCRMYPDDSGSYGHGPIHQNNYTVVVDIDEDGFNEVSEEFQFDSEIHANVIVPSPVPQTFDIEFEMFDQG